MSLLVGIPNTFGELSKKFRQKCSGKALKSLNRHFKRFGEFPCPIHVRSDNFGQIAKGVKLGDFGQISEKFGNPSKFLRNSRINFSGNLKSFLFREISRGEIPRDFSGDFRREFSPKKSRGEKSRRYLRKSREISLQRNLFRYFSEIFSGEIFERFSSEKSRGRIEGFLRKFFGISNQKSPLRRFWPRKGLLRP